MSFLSICAPELLTLTDLKGCLKLTLSTLPHCCCDETMTAALGCSYGVVVYLDCYTEENLSSLLYCVSQIPGGCTDCTLPIAWATENGKAVDVFVVLTNNPLWMFAASPVDSLKKHRQVQ